MQFRCKVAAKLSSGGVDKLIIDSAYFIVKQWSDCYFFFFLGILAPDLRASLRLAAIAWAFGWPAASISLMFCPITFLDFPLANGISLPFI